MILQWQAVMPRKLAALGVLACGFLFSNAYAAKDNMKVYIGTYTGGKSEGVYVCSFNQKTGELSTPELAAKTASPSFLAIHPKRRILYAVGESSAMGPKRHGAVSAFKINPETGKLELLNQQASGGSGPCHLYVEPKGKHLLVANYGSGSIASLPIQRDGSLSPAVSVIQHIGSSVNPKRQSGPHAHFITTDPKNRFVLSCDLGLDKVLVYQMDHRKGLLTPNTPPFAALAPGVGPRHLTFHPRGEAVYVVNEMGCSVTTFSYDGKTGKLSALGTVPTLPADFTGQNTCAAIATHPSGRFVYASNRGHDSVAIFRVKDNGLSLQPVGRQSTEGKTPRHFAIDPKGKWLIAQNQDSDSSVVFSINRKTGELTPTGSKVEVGKPVCLVFVD